MDYIFVLNVTCDVDKFELKKCKISAPQIGKCNLAITGGYKDVLLVNGWMKELNE